MITLRRRYRDIADCCDGLPGMGGEIAGLGVTPAAQAPLAISPL